MRFKNASMEIVPIIIVILSLFTGIQPTAINSNHSIANVASNDLNLVNGSNIYEYSVPRSSSNNYINLSKHHIQSKHIKTSTSFIGWMRLLF